MTDAGAWFAWALLSAVFAALTTIFARIGVAGIDADLATLLRTCDAAGACIALPDTAHDHQALSVGDSRRLRERSCIHWLSTDKDRWVRQQRAAGWPIVVVELADGAAGIGLTAREPRRRRAACSPPGERWSSATWTISPWRATCAPPARR